MALYNSTDGANWTNNTNWLSNAPLGDWHGVTVNDNGRVIDLSLSGNQLSGSVPPELGNLSSLQELDFADNADLAGPLPGSLTHLTNLGEMDLNGTGLCAPVDQAFQAWLGGVYIWGVLNNCTSEQSDRAALVALYNATDGEYWRNNTNWLTDAPLDEWHGVRTDPTTGRVLELLLYNNGLSGEIPPELISLSKLKGLYLSGNNLTGLIPAGLEGLTELTNLELGDNELTGEIPPEIGGLSHLLFLNLSKNNLSGSIPPELGNLRNLEVMLLDGNKLIGSIPPDLGGMTSLLGLRLGNNRLEGVIPKIFLGLEHLGSFVFSWNQGLCAPGTPAFVKWSQDVERRPSHRRISNHNYAGPFCSESDRIVLERLFETAVGANWTRSDMWLMTDVLEEWYGVSTDSLGRVTTLNLTGNGLAGGLPANLGNLANMGEMRIAMNEGLTGRFPASLTQLSPAHASPTLAQVSVSRPVPVFAVGSARSSPTRERIPSAYPCRTGKSWRLFIMPQAGQIGPMTRNG